ncbi:MAG: response regulator [Deltaproteobacteria bacterium]|nr:response regulator [Deltaproteobacteria bacterium]
MKKTRGHKLGDILREGEVADSSGIEKGLKYQRKTGERIASSLLFLGLASERDLAESLGTQKGVPAVVLGESAIELEVIATIPYKVSKQQLILPLKITEANIFLAMADPDDLKTAAEVEFVSGKKVIPHVALAGQLRRFIESARKKRTSNPKAKLLIGETLLEQGSPGNASFGQKLAVIKPTTGWEPALDEAWDNMEPMDAGLREPMDILPSESEAKKNSPSPKHILIVDDDPDILEMMSKYIEHKGFKVEKAENGTKALAKIRNNKPGLLILDAMLPGIHGFEICRKIKDSKRYSSVPVIMISAVYKGWRYSEDVRQTYGADDYLEKPFPLEKLYGKLKQFLSTKKEMVSDESLVNDAETALKEGLQAQGRGEIDTAIAKFKEGIAIDPMSHQLHFHLANLLAAQENYFMAIGELERAVELEPRFFTALKGLAVLYQKKGLLRKSIEMWERALYTAPDDKTRDKIRTHLFQLL